MVALELGFIFFLYIASYDARNSQSDFEHSVWLDEGNYKLHWKVNQTKKTIMFGAEVKTTGWIGFGISEKLTGKLPNADLMIAWMQPDGEAKLKDCHGDSQGQALLDHNQDIELMQMYKNNSWTIAKFKRKLYTCDKDDKDIIVGTLKLMFSWGLSKPKKHACSSLMRPTDRGSRSVNLMNHIDDIKVPIGTKYFDLLHHKVKVPAKRTTYWCTAYRLSDLIDLSSPKHIIAVEPNIQWRKNNLVHHMVLYVCTVFDPIDVSYSGECYSANTAKSVFSCAGATGTYAWGLGGIGFLFPESAGLAMGTKTGLKYVVLETHLNNEFERSDLIDTSGLRVFYSKPRKYEAAMMTIGTVVTDNMIIPPNMDEWTLRGTCSKACLDTMQEKGSLSHNSIKIFASFLHAHNTAISLRTTVVRNGVEIEEVERNENFDGHSQQIHRLSKEVEVKAGDELYNYCTYSTRNKKAVTLGGYGTNEEMCSNFLLYYPRINVTYCASDEIVTQPAFTAKYARPIFPPGMHTTLQNDWQFVNWTNVEWTPEMVNELDNFYNGNNPLPVIKQFCAAMNAGEVNLPVIYRPILKKKLAESRRKCPLRKLRNHKGIRQKN